jgi:hypothetical protein
VRAAGALAAAVSACSQSSRALLSTAQPKLVTASCPAGNQLVGLAVGDELMYQRHTLQPFKDATGGQRPALLIQDAHIVIILSPIDPNKDPNESSPRSCPTVPPSPTGTTATS